MLKYAALDVEVLIELRDALADQLHEQGKTEWARQEFAAIASASPPPPRADPWRRTSGIHKVRTRRALAVVRELWQTRDEIARDADLSPAPGAERPGHRRCRAGRGRQAAAGRPADARSDQRFHARYARKYSDRWAAAVLRARQLDDTELPEVAGAAAAPGPPPAHRWAERDPAAAARLAAARETVGALATTYRLPVENLLSPGRAAPPGLGTSGPGDRGDHHRGAAGLRSPPLAGGADGRAPRGGVRDRRGARSRGLTGAIALKVFTTSKIFVILKVLLAVIW